MRRGYFLQMGISNTEGVFFEKFARSKCKHFPKNIQYGRGWSVEDISFASIVVVE